MNVRAKALLWLLAVFLAGVISGAALAGLYHAGPGRGEVAGPPSSRYRHTEGDKYEEKKTERLVKAMVDRLELDAQQELQLREILEKSRDQYRQASQRSRQEFKEIRNVTRQKIKAILRPDQLPKFDEFVQRRKHRGSDPRKPSPTKD